MGKRKTPSSRPRLIQAMEPFKQRAVPDKRREQKEELIEEELVRALREAPDVDD